MNLFNILSEIEKVDPEVYERMNPRRAAIRNITSFGSKVTLAALPFAFTTIFKKAYGQTATTSVNDVLNFALKAEYLGATVYQAGVSASGLIPASDLPYIQKFLADENGHVAFLQGVLGAAAIPKPNIDPTAGGKFSDILTNYATFLGVSNTLEDTDVRAYKGQAPNLLGNQVVLTAALSIHAVEARHASAVRTLRSINGVPTLTPWILSTAQSSIDTGVPGVEGNYGAGATGYPAENNTIQGGVDVTTLASAYGTTTPFTVATAAFDEPLDMATVVNLISPFFTS